jgi:iron complex outermembrane receptor protein
MSSYLRSSIHTALFSAALAGAGVASAAEPQQTAFIEEIEIVVVTGSYIEGAAEDAALPIDVLRAEDLAKQGSPSMVELVKTLPAVQGVVGEANQYTAGGTSGTANINLRGLGGGRTLVLLNGRRLAPATVGVIGYDVNLLPMAAIGRIEILKDGAAATYGSDAVAGVVNFITKSGFDGLSLESSYTYVEDTDGDYTGNIAWGTKSENWDFLVAGGYRKRSALSTQDRDFVSSNVADNPQGGFSAAGNPGNFLYLTGATPTPFTDPGCASVATVSPVNGRCLYQFTQFNNLVEEEEQYQAYSEFNLQLGESTQFHIDALYAAHDVPEELASASYGPQQGPGLGAGGGVSAANYSTPKAPTAARPFVNPGYTPALDAAIRASLNPAQLAAYTNPANSQLIINGGLWRPFGSGGTPLTGAAKEDERFFEGYRLSTGLRGELSGINWDVALTYGANNSEINTYDIIANRLQAALQGMGGPNCQAGATPGSAGCLWLNPFSTAVARNPATGAINPLFNPNAVNTQELANWLYAFNGYEDTSTTAVGEIVLSGQMPLNLGAGDIGWASGIQYRKESFERDPNDLTDITKNPCVTSLTTALQPIANSTGCLAPNTGVPTGVFTFFGPITPQDLDRNVRAAFGELNIPVLENLSAQLAVRYEDYGGGVGSSTNPKLSMRWQALDWFGLRGSVGTTFRGPLQTQLLSSNTTGLAFVPAAGRFLTFDLGGNPNLAPEEAFTFNVGMIVKAGGFSSTLDYWSYDFEKSLENESGTEMVSTFFANGPTGQCGNPAFAQLQARFTFSGGACSVANLTRVQTFTINGPDQKISGLDLSLSYLFDEVLGGDILLGTDATYTLEYERDAAIVAGVQIQPAADFAGTRGASGIGAGTLVELRGSAYVDYSNDRHGVRITSRYVDGVTDVRTGLGTTASIAPATMRGVEIGSFLTHDLTYRLSLPAETTITASVFNFTDRDPPFARLELSYDPFIANPLGRYYRLLLNKQF